MNNVIKSVGYSNKIFIDSEYQYHIEQTKMFTQLLLDVLVNDYAEINQSFIASMNTAAIMHDLGKSFIPESIIFKKGTLSVSEYDVIKTHTTLGYEHFCSLSMNVDTPLNQIIKDVILYHHEHWDGTGYPHQKAGFDIPLSARIIALADVFEALISVRSYKEPFTFEKAKKIICESSGYHFDPAIVAAFLKQETKFERLTKTLQSQSLSRHLQNA
ncbi:MAG: HD domain-containing phosphohydrolase [Photobacterium frigidiphilum]|uniref:HD-GYP domain-containing protein n=1 Tax=Photobacterium frigidiphilum TaxID=264736 RepID=UPI0030020640